MKDNKKTEQKKVNTLTMNCLLSYAIDSLAYEFRTKYNKNLLLDDFTNLRDEVIALLNENKITITKYPVYCSYSFIKIFFNTKDEEKLALDTMSHVLAIIDKYGKK